MKYFIDSEFNEDGTVIIPISLALVAEDDRELYMESSEFKPEDCNLWVQKNVLPYLGPEEDRITRAEMRDRTRDFVAGDFRPEFWGYFCATDWVLFYQLWGTLMDLPRRFPSLCMDVRQQAHQLGVRTVRSADFLDPSEIAHHALHDARSIRRMHYRLLEIAEEAK